MANVTNGQIVWPGDGRKPYVVWLMDADDCEAVASCMPSSDGWVPDLLDAAERLREAERVPDIGTGLTIGIVLR